MARHGRPSFPAPATRPVGFSPATRHEARNMVFPRPCGHSKESNPKPDQQVFTNHETRLFVAVGAQGTHNQKPPPGPPRTPPGRFFPARCGAAWRGYGAAWAAAVPHTGNTACWVFTSHESRNMVLPLSSGGSKESNPKPGQQVFTNHETRDTNHGFYSSTRHETRNVSPFGSPWERKRHITKNLRRATVSLRPFAWPCAAWRGYGAAWAAVVPRTGNTACWVFTNQETRDTKHDFPRPCRDSKESNSKPGQQVFTNHETRNTNHGLYSSTSHEARNTVFPVPAATPRRATPSPTNRFFTNHETRDTNHGLYASLLTISHHFPRFPGISRQYSAPPPPPTDQGSARRPPFWVGLTKSAMRWKSHKNAQNPESHRKIREARCSPRVSASCAGCNRCGKRRMNPC